MSPYIAAPWILWDIDSKFMILLRVVLGRSVGHHFLFFDHFLVGALEPWLDYDFPFSWEWKIIPTDQVHHFSEG